jgi:hypothetical protein
VRISRHTQWNNRVPTKTLLHKRLDVREIVGEVRKSTLLHDPIHLLVRFGLDVRVYQHRQEERIQDGDTLLEAVLSSMPAFGDRGSHRISARAVHYRCSALCNHLLCLARLRAFYLLIHILKQLVSYTVLQVIASLSLELPSMTNSLCA